MKYTTANTIDAYMEALPKEVRLVLENLRKTIKSTVNAPVRAGVNCLPEIVQIDDLTAIFSDKAVQ